MAAKYLTEGSDFFVYDPNAGIDAIYAQGGDDTIFITNLSAQGERSLIVEGGGGFDTLDLVGYPYISKLTADSVILTNGSPVPNASAVTVGYSEIERLMVDAIAYMPSGIDLSWTTGDTMDEIRVRGALRSDELGNFQLARIVVRTGGGDDKIYLQNVGDLSEVYAGAGNDLVDLTGTFAAETFVYGEDGDDLLTGSAGEDILAGMDGDDRLNGGDGHDSLYGGRGMDTLDGGNGDDVLFGGLGRDIMVGGPGSDIFRYTVVQESNSAVGIDTLGFVRAEGDKIDLSAIGGLHWIVGPFTEKPGEVRATLVGFQVDVDGDALADMIVLAHAGWGGLRASDFLF